MNTFPSVVICDLPMQRKTSMKNSGKKHSIMAEVSVL